MNELVKKSEEDAALQRMDYGSFLSKQIHSKDYVNDLVAAEKRRFGEQMMYKSQLEDE